MFCLLEPLACLCTVLASCFKLPHQFHRKLRSRVVSLMDGSVSASRARALALADVRPWVVVPLVDGCEGYSSFCTVVICTLDRDLGISTIASVMAWFADIALDRDVSS